MARAPLQRRLNPAAVPHALPTEGDVPCGHRGATGRVAGNGLVDTGVLREITGLTRNRRFSYEPYVRRFPE